VPFPHYRFEQLEQRLPATLGLSGVSIQNPVTVIAGGGTASNYLLGVSAAGAGVAAKVTVKRRSARGTGPTTTSGLTFGAGLSGTGTLWVDYGPLVLSGNNNDTAGPSSSPVPAPSPVT